MIKVNWDVEELVALVDVYERASSGLLQDLSEKLEVCQMSLSSVLICWALDMMRSIGILMG